MKTSPEGRSVLVDARALHASGIGRYLREILAVLLRDERFSRVTLLGEPRALETFVHERGPTGAIEIREYPVQFYGAAPQVAWLRLLREGASRADVSFFPHYDVPLVALPGRSVVTVHDLIHFKVPGAFPLLRRLGAEVMLRRAVSGAARVITVSEHTRRTLVERLPAALGKTVAVPNGVSAFFRSVRGEPCPLATFPAANAPFLLCVGNRKAHKNLAAAVRVLSQLHPTLPELRLVFVGRHYPDWAEVCALADRLGVREAMVELEEVGDEALRWLYSHCEALLFPSLHEGFGFPVLEAMACGAPVVASNRSSVPEVAGEAGLLFDPEDAVGMAEAVRGLLRDASLRQELILRGRERAARFTWEQAAGTTIEILFQVASEGKEERLALLRSRETVR